MSARPGNRNAAKHVLPPAHVLAAYIRLISHRWISIGRAAKELGLPWSSLAARVPRTAPEGADTDLRSQWLLERAKKTDKRTAEQAKRERLRAEIEILGG